MSAVTSPTVVEAKASTRRSLACFNWNGALRAVYDTVCGGPTFIFIGFALALGVPETSVGRFTVAASLGVMFQLIGLPLLRKVTDRKRFVVRCMTIEPIVLVLAVLAAILLPLAGRQIALLVAVFAAAAFVHLAKPVHEDWLSSIIPAQLRGRFLGRHLQFCTLALIAATLIIGQSTDWIGNDNALGLAVLLAIGALFGLGSVAALNRAEMANGGIGAPFTMKQVVTIFANRDFRRYLAGSSLVLVPFMLGAPFYQALYQRGLNMSLGSIAMMMITYLSVKACAARLAGRMVDRHQPRIVALCVVPMYATFFFILAMATPETTWLVFVAWGVAGIADGTYAPALLTARYAAIPTNDCARPAYFAASNIANLGLLAVGAVIAEMILRWCAANPVEVAGHTLGKYQMLYLLCGVLMAIGVVGACLLTNRRPARVKVPKPAET